MHGEGIEIGDEPVGREPGTSALKQRDVDAVIERVFIAAHTQIAIRIAILGEGQSDVDMV